MRVANRGFLVAHSRRACGSFPRGCESPEEAVSTRFRYPESNQKEQAHQHGEIGASVAHPEPESLSSVSQLRNFRGHDSRADDDEKGNRCDPSPQASQDQQSANDFERSPEVRGESRTRKADPCETLHAGRAREAGRALTKVIQLTPLGRKSGSLELASPEVLDQMFRRAQ